MRAPGRYRTGNNGQNAGTFQDSARYAEKPKYVRPPEIAAISCSSREVSMSTRVRESPPIEPLQGIQTLKHADRSLAQPAVAVIETPGRCPSYGEILVKLFHLAHHYRHVEQQFRALRPPPSRAARGARRSTPAARRLLPALSCEDDRSPVSSSVITSDVPPGVHRGDGYAERARFKQHAAQRLRPVRRKDQERGMTEPPEDFLPVQPLQHFHFAARARRRRPSAIAVRCPSPMTTSGHIEFRMLDDIHERS